MKKKVGLLLLILVLADCAGSVSRQNNVGGSKKETPFSRTAKTKTTRTRGEVIENLFSIYDPSFLSVVWPKLTNGVHLFVEAACWEDLSVFFKDLADGRAWAYGAVDASGRYQSGLLKGNRFWLGSKAECLQLDKCYVARESNDTFDEFHNGDYLNTVLRREKYFDGGAEEWRALVKRDELMRRLVEADHAPPYRLAYSAADVTLNLTKLTMAESYDITLGVCLPRSCNPEDIASILNFSIMINDNFKSNRSLPRSVKVSSARHLEKYYNIRYDIGAIVLICVTGIIVILAITATLVDLKVLKCTRNRKSMSFDLHKINSLNTKLDRALNEEHSKFDVLSLSNMSRKQSNVVDMETLTINNINNANNINLVTVKKVVKQNSMPPSITLDVVSMDRDTGSCMRCGKYKKQCSNITPRPGNLPACPRVKSFASITTENNRKNGLFKSLLLCFSLTYSWKRIFNTNMANKDLCFVHALRIFATFWIIFVHVTTVANYVSENSGDINERNNAYYILATGTFAFDTMFFVSGLLSAHHFFFLKSQYSVEELVSFGGACGHVMQFVCFVTNRAIRLLPSYAYAIFLSATLSRALYRTSALALPEHDAACHAHWWRNLLYITTLFPKEEQCMQVSWLMSVETQLHVAGALAGAAGAPGRRLGSALAALAVLLLAATDIGAAYYDYPRHLADVFAAYATMIERPLARVAPYFAGIFAGWLIHRTDGHLSVSWSQVGFLWWSSLVTLGGALWASWAARAWAAAWLHPLWPLALLWPAAVFANNLADVARRFLDNSCVAALSRLSCGMVLLHGPVARALLLASDVALCSHTSCLWMYFTGTAVLTVLAALVLSLFIETPCCSLLRRLSDYAT